MLVFLGVLQVGFFMDLDINDIAEGLRQLHKKHPEYEHLELAFDFRNICYKLYGQKYTKSTQTFYPSFSN